MLQVRTPFFDLMSLLFIGIVFIVSSLVTPYSDNYMFGDLNIFQFNLLKPTGYGMHQQAEYLNNCTLCPYYVYVFCIYLRTNSNLSHSHKKLIGFYNRDEKCLQRGTDWASK
jgi:hypothetical protein